MKIARALVAVAMIACVETCVVYATEYGVVRGSAINKGRNFDPRDPTRLYPQCLTWTGEVQQEALNPKSPISPLTSFTITEIKDRRQLHQEMYSDTKVSGHYGLFSGGASSGLDKLYDFESDSMVFIVKAVSDFGAWDLVDARLTPEAMAMVRLNQIDAFTQTCGTEFVGSTRRAVMAALVFSIKNISSQSQERLRQVIGGGVKAASFGAEVSSAYGKFVNEAQLNSLVSVRTEFLGGPGASALSGLLSNYHNTDKVKEIMEGYLSGLTFEKSTPVSFTSAQLTSYTQGKFKDYDLADYLRYIERIWLARSDMDSRLERVNDDMKNAEDLLLNDGARKQLSAHSKAIVGKMEQLELKASACNRAYTSLKLSNSAAGAPTITKQCVITPDDLNVPAYPIIISDRAPVKVTHSFYKFATAATTSLVVEVSGATLLDAYLRLPAAGTTPMRVLSRHAEGPPAVFRGSVDWDPSWQVVDVVSVLRSGNTTVTQVTLDPAVAASLAKGTNPFGMFALPSKVGVKALLNLQPYERPK